MSRINDHLLYKSRTVPGEDPIAFVSIVLGSLNDLVDLTLFGRIGAADVILMSGIILQFPRDLGIFVYPHHSGRHFVRHITLRIKTVLKIVALKAACDFAEAAVFDAYHGMSDILFIHRFR